MSGIVKLDIEVIEQWLDWLDTGDEGSLRADLVEVLRSAKPRPPRPEPTDEMLMAIINAWVEPGRVHVPGCVLTDLESYCLDCHVTASNALDEMKRRRGEEDTD